VAPEHYSHGRSVRRSARAATRPAAVLCVLATALAVVFSLGLGPSAASAGTQGDAAFPRRDLLELALAAYRRVQDAGLLHTRVLTVIDYSLPSSQRRLWVIDPDRLRVLFHDFVAHGRGSATEEDPDRAVQFGNDPESHRSSLGAFLTGETYTGKHGHSLELIGLEPGVNDRAVERRIVIHPADYVSASFRAQRGGRVGRSWGCPALDPAVAPAIIDRIQDGSVVFVAGASAPQRAALPLATLARVSAFGSRTASATSSCRRCARSAWCGRGCGAPRHARVGGRLPRTRCPSPMPCSGT